MPSVRPSIKLAYLKRQSLRLCEIARKHLFTTNGHLQLCRCTPSNYLYTLFLLPFSSRVFNSITCESISRILANFKQAYLRPSKGSTNQTHIQVNVITTDESTSIEKSNLTNQLVVPMPTTFTFHQSCSGSI